MAAVIGAQAYSVAQRFKGQVEQEDLEQEGWVWVCEHPGKMKDHESNEDSGLAAYRLSQDVWGVMDRYARREKAARGGYQPEDELFVSDAVINIALLQNETESEWLTRAIQQKAATGSLPFWISRELGTPLTSRDARETSWSLTTGTECSKQK